MHPVICRSTADFDERQLQSSERELPTKTSHPVCSEAAVHLDNETTRRVDLGFSG